MAVNKQRAHTHTTKVVAVVVAAAAIVVTAACGSSNDTAAPVKPAAAVATAEPVSASTVDQSLAEQFSAAQSP